MIIPAAQQRVEHRSGERLGTSTKLLEEEQMHGEAKVFARVALRPGACAPLHQHVGSFEAFYILAGRGRVNDNGAIAEIGAGDVVECEVTGIGRIRGQVIAIDAPRASALGVGHQPTDSPEVRRVALGFDERVPSLLKDNLARARERG